MQIDGHTVLRENNYVVRGGDYVFGDEEPDAPIAAPAPKKAKAAAAAPAAPRQRSATETARLAHNNELRADAARARAGARRGSPSAPS